MNNRFAISLVFLCTTTIVWAAEPEDAERESPTRYLVVEMTCSPDDTEAVRATLQTALALRQAQSEVTLFIDMAAIPIAESSTAKQPAKLRRETDRLFAKLRAAGVTMLVCPYCAKKQDFVAARLRDGLRFTTKEELDAVRRQAEQIYEFQVPAPDTTEDEPHRFEFREVSSSSRKSNA